MSLMATQRGWITPIAAFLLLVGALALGACGSDEENSAPQADNGAAQTDTDYQAELETLYEGTHAEPTGDPIEPEEGMNLWVVSIGQEAEAAQNAAEGLEESAEKLGWDLTIFDGQFDPNRTLTGINQALADKADGIITLYADCPALKTGLQRADKEQVPVVAVEGSDCNDLNEGDPQLFDYVVRYSGDASFREWITDWGRAMAIWVIAQTEGDTNAIVTRETDLETTKLQAAGTIEELEGCADCEMEVIDFVGADIGPPLQEKIEQALIQNPDANAFVSAYDAILTSGGANALKASGRVDEIAIMGGEGSEPGLQLIRENGGNDACICYPTKWEGYAAVDALARFFLGEDPAETNSGMGFQAVDADHNMPPEGQGYEPPIDFVAAYDRLWGVG